MLRSLATGGGADGCGTLCTIGGPATTLVGDGNAGSGFSLTPTRSGGVTTVVAVADSAPYGRSRSTAAKMANITAAPSAKPVRSNEPLGCLNDERFVAGDTRSIAVSPGDSSALFVSAISSATTAYGGEAEAITRFGGNVSSGGGRSLFCREYWMISARRSGGIVMRWYL